MIKLVLILLLTLVFLLLIVKGFISLSNRGKIAVLLSLVISILLVKIVLGFIPLPIVIRHFINVVIDKDGLYKPIVTDNYLFYDQGFSKTYILDPRFLDIYEIGIKFKGEKISSKYKFQGQLKVEFFHGYKLLFDKVITSFGTAGFEGNDMQHYKEISFMHFSIPLKGIYNRDISVKLTVLEPDMELKRFGDSAKLFIAVTATP